MSDLTIEQLEALKEGTNPGPWITHAGSFGRIESVGPIEPGFSGNGLECTEEDADLAAAAPAFVDALIAEKRKHDDLRQEIGSLIGKLETRAENAESNRAYALAVAFRESERDLARILEATDD